VTVSTRKNEILALARTLFAERGYSATSMRDLAEASGVLPGSLYAHFRSKADLVRQIVMEFYVDLLPEQQAAFDSEGSGAVRFALMIDTVYDVCVRHAEAVRTLHYDWQVLARLEEMAEMLEATDRTLDLWHDAALDGVKDGSIDPDIDPEYMVRIATSAVHGMLDPGRFTMRAAPTSSLPPAEHVKRALLLGITTPTGAGEVQRVIQGPPGAAARPARTRTPGTSVPKKKAAKRVTKGHLT
jgi:AcrR family transcriptional regulator